LKIFKSGRPLSAALILQHAVSAAVAVALLAVAHSIKMLILR
jgi:hypothetical protein